MKGGDRGASIFQSVEEYTGRRKGEKTNILQAQTAARGYRLPYRPQSDRAFLFRHDIPVLCSRLLDRRFIIHSLGDVARDGGGRDGWGEDWKMSIGIGSRSGRKGRV